MTKELNQIRSKLTGINRLLKEGKLMPAVNALYEAVNLFLRTTLLSQEKQEFRDLLDKAIYLLNGNEQLNQIYPLKIEYTSGDEKALSEQLRNVLQELQQAITDQAKQQLADLEKEKRIRLEKAQNLLHKEQFDQGRTIFETLVKDFPKDTDLKIDIGERYLKLKLYEESIHFLEQALKQDPTAVLVLNRLGMALRKAGRFEEAEKVYLDGIEVDSKDEYLYFNLGRVYIDWGKWEEAAATAERALDINPKFQEAAKMRQYARKKSAQ